MSMDYWGIIGYGVCLDDIYDYLNREKVNTLVRKLLPKETFEEDVFDDDTFYGNPYNNLAEFLCDLDEDKIFSWNDDGQGAPYFLYFPSYPWQRKENEPTDVNEVTDKMVKILHKVYDMPINELRKMIHYISTYGCG